MVARRTRELRKTGGERLEEEIYRRGILTGAVHVAEFPKSGGTWIRAMIIDAYAESNRRSVPRVIHHHWPYRRAYRPAIHVVRDGRDVVVSLYHHNARLIRSSSYWAPRVSSHFSRILGQNFDIEDVRGNLPSFIRGLEIDPFGGFLRPRRRDRFLSWPEHANSWHRRTTLTVMYERMLAAPNVELGRIVQHLQLPLDGPTMASIVARNSFENLSGRPPGSEDRSSFLRKGVAGEWTQVFSDEAGDEFNRYGGRALIDLGYEIDGSWTRKVGGPPR